MKLNGPIARSIEHIIVVMMLLTAVAIVGCGKRHVSPYDESRLWFQRTDQTETTKVTIDSDSKTAEIIRSTVSVLGIEQHVKFVKDTTETELGEEGYTINVKRDIITATACGERGLLYAAMELRRQVCNGTDTLKSITEVPAYDIRMLEHRDRLDGSIRNGYDGKSLWDWNEMTSEVMERYKEYAMANASVGINSIVINDTEGTAEILSASHLPKIAAIADVMRPYGIKIYLSADLNAPKVISNIECKNMQRANVKRWWGDQISEIYAQIPDFGGFVIEMSPKQEGLQTECANIIARRLERHGGIVIWKGDESKIVADRATREYNEIKELDGDFANNVIVLVKSQPIDYEPREPINPLLGGLVQTQVGVEVTLSQDHMGMSNHLCYLKPMWEEALTADTYLEGQGSTVGKVTRQHRKCKTLIAGIANISDSKNWCGHPLAQANWYAFGRMAWNPELSADSIVSEWIRHTYQDLPASTEYTLRAMMMESHEAMVDYMMPLGLHQLAIKGHDYMPLPWANDAQTRSDSLPSYYHKADMNGIGYDRTTGGSGACMQYNEPLQSMYADVETCPDEYLLWFHHVGWSHRMKSGRTLWTELCYKYNRGVTMTGHFIASWKRLQPYVDEDHWTDVNRRLHKQCSDARWWHDANLLYFQNFSGYFIPQKTKYKLEDIKKSKLSINDGETPGKGMIQ